jgi:hypothetical protein
MSISLYERAGCPPHKKYNLCGTGILPVLEKLAGCPPIINTIFVEQASCLFLKIAKCPFYKT